jgi:hypothetical protein
MSVERESFHSSVVSKRYDEAVITLNGLNMAEMLPALAAIAEQHRTALIRSLIGAVGKIGVQRIQYAISIDLPTRKQLRLCGAHQESR